MHDSNAIANDVSEVMHMNMEIPMEGCTREWHVCARVRGGIREGNKFPEGNSKTGKLMENST